MRGTQRRVRQISGPSTFPATEDVTFTNYGRTAFEQILRSERLSGATVLFPAFFCRTSFTHLVDNYELTPEFVDVDPGTYHPDFEQARRVMSDVDVLVLPHTFGVPADVTRWKRLAAESDVLLIEDCARALGATIQGRPVGSGGDFAIYSLRKVSPVSKGGVVVGPVDAADLSQPDYDVTDVYPHLPDTLQTIAKYGYDGVKWLSNGASEEDAQETPPVPRRLDKLNEFAFRYHLRRGFGKQVRRNETAAQRIRPPLDALEVEFQTTRGHSPYHFLGMTIPGDRDEVVTRLRDADVPVRTCWEDPLVTAFVEEHRLAETYPNTDRLTREAIQLPLREMDEADVTRAIGLLAEEVATRSTGHRYL